VETGKLRWATYRFDPYDRHNLLFLETLNFSLFQNLKVTLTGIWIFWIVCIFVLPVNYYMCTWLVWSASSAVILLVHEITHSWPPDERPCSSFPFLFYCSIR